MKIYWFPLHKRGIKDREKTSVTTTLALVSAHSFTIAVCTPSSYNRGHFPSVDVRGMLRPWWWLDRQLWVSVCVMCKTTPAWMHTQLMSEIPHHACPLGGHATGAGVVQSCPVITQKFAKSDFPLAASLSCLFAQKHPNLIHVNRTASLFSLQLLTAKYGEENKIHLQIMNLTSALLFGGYGEPEDVLTSGCSGG